ncbi:hypothetical protein IFG57_004007 [Salmonella enterica]|nr:hypothetical protein [Salmonella enterica]
MINRYRPEGENREWKTTSMVIQLDAELNYLLETMCRTGSKDQTPKKDMVLKFIRSALEKKQEIQ